MRIEPIDKRRKIKEHNYLHFSCNNIGFCHLITLEYQNVCRNFLQHHKSFNLQIFCDKYIKNINLRHIKVFYFEPWILEVNYKCESLSGIKG